MEKKNKEDRTNRVVRHSILSNIWFWLKIYWRYTPGVVLTACLGLALGALVPLVGIYLPKLVLDLLAGETSAEGLIRTLCLWGIMTAALYGLNAATYGKYYVQNNARNFVMLELYLKSLRLSYEIPESEWGKKAYHEAMGVTWGGDWSASTKTFDGTFALLQNLLCFVLYSTVLSVLNPWIILGLLILSLLNVLVIKKGLHFEESMREREAVHGRHWNYILSAMGNMTAAKDVRIFGMNTWLTGIRDQAIREREEDKRAFQRMNNWQYSMNGLIGLVRDVAAYGYLIYCVARGDISVSDFVLYFGAVAGFSGFITNMLQQIGNLMSARNATDYFRAYMELPEELSEEESLTPLPADGQCGSPALQSAPGVVFENVSFAYKKEDGSPGEQILEHFNLTIAPGEKLALVGVNGAGKTTLVKLLCGLYQPDEGRILVNGRSREEMTPGEWYRQLSVVFQQQLILPVTMAENISLQRWENTDDARAWAALERAGLSDTFAHQKITLDTYMKKTISPKGIELSGGQQQRLMLARALYKDAPLLVLDEPTAALDPIAESQVYESYLEHSRNKTAIFISHRLASTRFSDRIILIEHGRIIEEGTHEQLMEKQGAYAHMYQVQSSYYEGREQSEETGNAAAIEA